MKEKKDWSGKEWVKTDKASSRFDKMFPCGIFYLIEFSNCCCCINNHSSACDLLIWDSTGPKILVPFYSFFKFHNKKIKRGCLLHLTFSCTMFRICGLWGPEANKLHKAFNPFRAGIDSILTLNWRKRRWVNVGYSTSEAYLEIWLWCLSWREVLMFCLHIF